MYLVEIYDETQFASQYPAMYSLATTAKAKAGCSSYVFCQCLSMDGITFEVLYEDLKSDQTFWMEGSGNSITNWDIMVDSD